MKKSHVLLGSLLAATLLYAPLRVDSGVDLSTTSAIALPDPAISPLQTGLDALKNGDVAGARSIRDGLVQGALDRHILQWSIALSASDTVSSDDIQSVMTNLPDWPGHVTLRNNLERALYRENANADAVIAALADRQSQTAKGAAILARAFMTKDNRQAAIDIIAPFWRTAKMEPADERLILAEFSHLFTSEDHFARMQSMLYAERIAAAGRVAALGNATGLYEAWAAVIRNTSNAQKLIDTVSPKLQKTAAFQFVQVLHLRKLGKFKQAATLMADARLDDQADTDAWWTERRTIARALLERGEDELAYKTVSGDVALSVGSKIDAEFHAGWIALRALKKPELAATHFSTMLTLSTKPQSASRGYYWLGRALEASGKSGDVAFKQAAHFGTNFYGQLAAARLNLTTLEVPSPLAGNEDHRRFNTREAVAAIQRLQTIGYGDRARALYFDLAEELESVGEISLLASKANASGDYFTTLKIGKIAAARGLNVGALSHPTGAIPATANIAGSGQALAYAIARQESEFNIAAVSKVGARGLLQLMPATAQEVARRNGIVFELARLTNDASYNATLGAHFLGEQIDRFDGSYILTFAGYNAGPRRAREWIEKYGDPRGKSIDDVVDWIESIPFSETRNYVQRVMENYQVYKVRLGGSVNIEDDLRFGRRI